MPQRLPAFALLLAACLCGCDSAPSPDNSADEVTVEIMDYDAFQGLLKQQQGKVVVLDCWSTSCAPCKEEFHNLVELSEEYPAEKLACVSLSFDYFGLDEPEKLKEPVLEFLSSQNAKQTTNILSSTPDEQLYEKFGFGAIPAVLVFNQQGEEVQRFLGGEESEGVGYDKIKELVKQLVAGEPAAASGE